MGSLNSVECLFKFARNQSVLLKVLLANQMTHRNNVATHAAVCGSICSLLLLIQFLNDRGNYKRCCEKPADGQQAHS